MGAKRLLVAVVAIGTMTAIMIAVKGNAPIDAPIEPAHDLVATESPERSLPPPLPMPEKPPAPEDVAQAMDRLLAGASEEQIRIYRRLAGIGPSDREKEQIRRVTSRPAMTVYEEYIARAQAGNASAQYVVASVLDSCMQTLDDGWLKPREAKGLRRNVERCRGLKELASDRAALFELSESWYEKAIDNGSSLADLRLFMTRKSGRFESEEELYQATGRMAQLIAPALRESRSDGYLKRSAISLTKSFYDRFQTIEVLDARGVDSTHLIYERDMELAVWRHLECAYIAGICPFPQYIDQLEADHYQYEMEEIAERAIALEKSINVGEVSELAFK